jgi:hypothetical protein
MKIVGIIQPTQSVDLLKKEMGEFYERVVWVICRRPEDGQGAPEFGIVHAALEREKPDLIIAFGRIIQDTVTKDFQGYGTIIHGPTIPEFAWFEESMALLRKRIQQQLAAPPTHEQTEEEHF